MLLKVTVFSTVQNLDQQEMDQKWKNGSKKFKRIDTPVSCSISDQTLSLVIFDHFDRFKEA